MKPNDNKSLLQFIFDQMGKLDNNEIDCDQAKTQAQLAKEANNAMMYDLKKADLILKIHHSGIKLDEFGKVEMRNAAGNLIRLPLYGNPFEPDEDKTN